MFNCKICNAKVATAKKPTHLKDNLLKYSICVNCYNGINGSYKKTWNSKENPYQGCVFCGDATRPYGNIPVCISASCRSKFYQFKTKRNKILEQLSNGGLKLSEWTINHVRDLGFDVVTKSDSRNWFVIKIKAKPDYKTFLNGVKVIDKR